MMKCSGRERRNAQARRCSCRDGSACPVGARCLRDNVVYRATVQHGGRAQRYMGVAGDAFRAGCAGHRASFKHRTHRKRAELSNLMWDLKDGGISCRLTWKLVAQAQPYKPGRMACNVCLCEKYNILINKNLINRKSELLNKCPHRRKYLTYNIKP